MQNSVKISITGDLGSGKSVVSKHLCETLGAEKFSTGALQRKIAAEMGMTTLELNKYAETHPEIDDRIDGELKNLRHLTEPIVIDSRMAWHFVPGSFKIYLIVSPRVAAERIMMDETRKSEDYDNIDEAIAKIRLRKKSENARFLHFYNVDGANLANYDLAVETTCLDADTVGRLILEKHDDWRAGTAFPQLWLCPQSLYPTQPIAQAGTDATEAVRVIDHDGYFFIYKGHAQVQRAFETGQKLVPATLHARSEAELEPGMTAAQFVEMWCDRGVLQGWEAGHGFQFADYPPMLSL